MLFWLYTIPTALSLIFCERLIRKRIQDDKLQKEKKQRKIYHQYLKVRDVILMLVLCLIPFLNIFVLLVMILCSDPVLKFIDKIVKALNKRIVGGGND